MGKEEKEEEVEEVEEVEDVEEGELEEEEEVVKGRAQLTATAPLRTLFALSTRIFLFFKE